MPIRSLILCFTLSFFIFSEAFSQQVILFGKGNDFSGEKIVFYALQDPFYNLKDTLLISEVNEKGILHDSLIIIQTTCIYVETGPFLSYIFVEPDKEYEIKLPDVSEYPEDWKANPYYEKQLFHLVPVEVHSKNFGKVSDIELNRAIRLYNSHYDPFMNKQLMRYYLPGEARTKLDSFLSRTFIEGTVSDSQYFEDYRHYKEGILETLTRDFNTDSIIKHYFRDKKIRFELPPYNRLFSLIFNRYFDHPQKQKILFRLIDQLTNDIEVDDENLQMDDPLLRMDTIMDIVLLRQIYHMYYSESWNKDNMIRLTDRIGNNSGVDVVQQMAKWMIRNFKHLKEGYRAPFFQARNLDGEKILLEDLKGNYLYLGFCEVDNLSCLREFEFLKSLHQRHQEHLQIATIINTDDREALKKTAIKNNWNWAILYPEDAKNLIQQYEVYAFPVFYLIDPQGTMLRSPAKLPSEGFEQQLFRIMKSRGDL